MMQSQLMDRALEIGRERRKILAQMRDAIRANDKDLVFNLARKLTGLSNEECIRTNQSVN
jgi:hypothetical protein